MNYVEVLAVFGDSGVCEVGIIMVVGAVCVCDRDNSGGVCCMCEVGIIVVVGWCEVGIIVVLVWCV